MTAEDAKEFDSCIAKESILAMRRYMLVVNFDF